MKPRMRLLPIWKTVLKPFFMQLNFAEAELARYIVKRMCGFDTAEEESIITQKSLHIVMLEYLIVQYYFLSNPKNVL